MFLRPPRSESAPLLDQVAPAERQRVLSVGRCGNGPSDRPAVVSLPVRSLEPQRERPRRARSAYFPASRLTKSLEPYRALASAYAVRALGYPGSISAERSAQHPCPNSKFLKFPGPRISLIFPCASIPPGLFDPPPSTGP